MILTVIQLAKELQVRKEHIYHLANAGKIPGFRVGGAWRFDRDAVLEHLKNPPVAVKKHRISVVNLLYPEPGLRIRSSNGKA